MSRPVWLGEDRRGWDHVRIHVDLLDTPGIGAYEIAVYAGLAAHAESTRTGWTQTPLRDLAAYCECGTGRVRKAIQALVDTGWLSFDPADPAERIRLGAAAGYRLERPPRPDARPATPTPDEGVPPAPGEGVLSPGAGVPSSGEGVGAGPTSYGVNQRERPLPPASGDAVRLCGLLADLIEANGSKRPTITLAWFAEAERMLRLDGRDPAKAERLIRWCQADGFWRANVMSMPTFRKQYDKLRLAANRSVGQGDRQLGQAEQSLREYQRRRDQGRTS